MSVFLRSANFIKLPKLASIRNGKGPSIVITMATAVLEVTNSCRKTDTRVRRADLNAFLVSLLLSAIVMIVVVALISTMMARNRQQKLSTSGGDDALPLKEGSFRRSSMKSLVQAVPNGPDVERKQVRVYAG